MEAGKIYTIKLNSGEEVITKVVEITRDNLIITDPVSIAPGQQGMQMIPSMFTAEPRGKVTLNTNAIAFYANTDDKKSIVLLKIRKFFYKIYICTC